jgi:hypothetical protein
MSTILEVPSAYMDRAVARVGLANRFLLFTDICEVPLLVRNADTFGFSTISRITHRIDTMAKRWVAGLDKPRSDIALR